MIELNLNNGSGGGDEGDGQSVQGDGDGAQGGVQGGGVSVGDESAGGQVNEQEVGELKQEQKVVQDSSMGLGEEGDGGQVQGEEAGESGNEAGQVEEVGSDEQNGDQQGEEEAGESGNEAGQVEEESGSNPSTSQREGELQQAVVANNVPEFVQVLMSYAIEQEASDIHIEPMLESVRVRFRIDGVLRRIIEYPKNLHAAVIARIKILSSLKIDEQRLPQDGRTQLVTDTGKEMDVRVSTLPTVNGEKVCMRLQDKSRDIPDFEALGLKGRNREVLEEAILSPNGIFLVTGPTGSGKTTTLYSALQKLNKVEDNIMTCEDPVEYQMDGLNQSQMNSEIGLDFAAGLRTALRQDPDIIMVGEIRDLETVDIAVRSALTGHFVLSTIHTNSSVETITRLLDMGAKPFLIASTVRAILAQRLVRKVCTSCAEEYKPDEKALIQLKKDIKEIGGADDLKKWIENPSFMKGKGCDVCGGRGFKGRVGIYEALKMSSEIERMIVQDKSAQEIKNQALKEGLVTLKTDGIRKVMEGLTTLEEVYKIVGQY